jgi:hypothetical protein
MAIMQKNIAWTTHLKPINLNCSPHVAKMPCEKNQIVWQFLTENAQVLEKTFSPRSIWNLVCWFAWPNGFSTSTFRQFWDKKMFAWLQRFLEKKTRFFKTRFLHQSRLQGHPNHPQMAIIQKNIAYTTHFKPIHLNCSPHMAKMPCEKKRILWQFLTENAQVLEKTFSRRSIRNLVCWFAWPNGFSTSGVP